MATTQINGGTQIKSGSVTLDRLSEAVIQADGGQAFTADQPHGGFKITNLGDGTASTDAATKGQLDAAVQGYDWKNSVRVATTAAGTLASSFENGDSVDGVTLATGNRILLKNQASGSENGIYTVNASGAPTRATDADSSAKVTGGMAVLVTEGTTNGNTQWILATDDPITLGTTALSFAQIGAGAGGGTVTDVSVVSANGFAGSVANSSLTPAITLTTTVSGVLKGNATAISAAAAGTDYVAPGGALGTPSSGTLTNCSGLPLSGVVDSTTEALGAGSIELGHASDTTIARSSAGVVTIEGNVIYRAGGTDVPITDGGTGVSTLPSGLLKGAGTSAITAATAGTDYVAPATFVDKETPTGAVNGSNTAYTLANTPISGSEHVYYNGLLQEGGGEDYTLSGTTVTFVSAPVTGSRIRVTYRK